VLPVPDTRSVLENKGRKDAMVWSPLRLEDFTIDDEQRLTVPNNRGLPMHVSIMLMTTQDQVIPVPQDLA